jgi:hypothetical protein
MNARLPDLADTYASKPERKDRLNRDRKRQRRKKGITSQRKEKVRAQPA